MNKYSIIVPIYNITQSYLIKCLESLHRQSYKNLEILLIDDGSTKENADLCDHYKTIDKRVKVFHQKNHGVSSARNLGIKKSTGDYIIFVDGDDYLDECISDIEKNNKGFDLIFFPFLKRTSTGIKEKIIFNEDKIFNLNTDSDRKIFYNMNILGSSCGKVYKKSLITSLFDTNLTNGEDVFFNYCNINKFKTAFYINNPYYIYNIHGDSAVRNNSDDTIGQYIKTIKKMNSDNEYLLSLKYSFSAIALLMLVLHLCFSSENKYTYGKNKAKAIFNNPTFKSIFSNTNYIQLPITRKICVYMCKYHMYLPLYLISRIKHGGEL